MTLLQPVEVGHGSAGLSVAGRRARPWVAWYVPTAFAVDLVSATVASLAAALSMVNGVSTPYRMAMVALLPALWCGACAANRLYEPRYLGVGVEEFRRLANSAVAIAAATGFVAYVADTHPGRRYVIVALPVVLTLDLAGRYTLRKVLHRRRQIGLDGKRVVLVGPHPSVRELVDRLRHEHHHGLEIVGACLPDSGQVPDLLADGIPVIGGFDQVKRAVEVTGADTVAVASSADFGGLHLRRLAWALEPLGTELLVAPGLIEVAGPRLTIHPVAGLPLLHVDRPRLSGARRLLKGSFDRTLAGLVLTLVSPILLVIGVAIRLTTPGPALFRQTRVGQDGHEFTLMKFRTMSVDAEDQLEKLLELNEHDGVLFKIRNDPRITRFGAFLRKYSLDELPQLLNVVRGQMSLVGPRPPLVDEVARYSDDVRRRLLVRPGITGLWQVSGRANLTWDESVRLDLRYVDNWSLALDLLILWKTGRAVLRHGGAY